MRAVSGHKTAEGGNPNGSLKHLSKFSNQILGKKYFLELLNVKILSSWVNDGQARGKPWKKKQTHPTWPSSLDDRPLAVALSIQSGPSLPPPLYHEGPSRRVRRRHQASPSSFVGPMLQLKKVENVRRREPSHEVQYIPGTSSVRGMHCSNNASSGAAV